MVGDSPWTRVSAAREPTASRQACILGVAFGASVPFVLSHLARHGELPMSPFGWRYMAGRPVEQLSPDQFIALGWALVGVSALAVVAGIWLWQGRRGPKLGLANVRSGPRPRCRLQTAAAPSSASRSGRRWH